MQKRLHSTLEAIINVLVGWVIAAGIYWCWFRYKGIDQSVGEINTLVAIFMAVSFMRSYVLRRLFNRFLAIVALLLIPVVGQAEDFGSHAYPPNLWQQSHELEEVTIRWVRVDPHGDPSKLPIACRWHHLSMTHGINGCATFNPRTKTCTIYAPKPRTWDDQRRMIYIGHEVLHCFYGHFHPARMLPNGGYAVKDKTE